MTPHEFSTELPSLAPPSLGHAFKQVHLFVQIPSTVFLPSSPLACTQHSPSWCNGGPDGQVYVLGGGLSLWRHWSCVQESEFRWIISESTPHFLNVTSENKDLAPEYWFVSTINCYAKTLFPFFNILPTRHRHLKRAFQDVITGFFK